MTEQAHGCYDEASTMGRALEAEFQHLFRQMGVLGWVGHFLAIGVFGVLVPLKQGLDFYDVLFLLAYACLPCLFAAPLVAESVAGRRTAPPKQGYLAQVITPFLFAVFWNLVILGSGFAVVNASHWFGRPILPPTPILINILVLSFAATLFSAAGAGWLALNAKTAADAKRQARRLFLLILLAVIMWAKLAPPQWRWRVEQYLAAGEISYAALPLSLALAATGVALMRAGVRRRVEEADGPLPRLK